MIKLPLHSIAAINEERMLKEMGVPSYERRKIQGLRVKNVSSHSGLSEEQQSANAIARLAANPPLQVGQMQRHTARWLLRPFPLGLRFSGRNMSPLPCWLGGAQNVALNFSEADLGVCLHFALFRGSDGFVLKPPEMRHASDAPCATSSRASGIDATYQGDSVPSAVSWDRSSGTEGDGVPLRPSRGTSSAADLGRHSRLDENDLYWPPSRMRLQRVTMEIQSLHGLPNVRVLVAPLLAAFF